MTRTCLTSSLMIYVYQDQNTIVNRVMSTHTDLKVFEKSYFGDGKATEKIIRVLEAVFGP
ncbi:MAG TPA: hypothetical protein VEF53_15035 [Patescibacteria group bacterium]|nr:hypothetical protein [Patescibacteria group bacterium]